MNKENVQLLRNVIASEKYSLNMNTPEAKPQCGSGGCIGGHMAIIWPECRTNPAAKLDDELLYIERECAKKLGVTIDEIETMFYQYPRRPDAKRPQVLAMLDRLIATEVVSWS